MFVGRLERGHAVPRVGNTQGGVEALHSIRMIEVEKIEPLNGSEATQRFGTRYAGGAILVTRRK